MRKQISHVVWYGLIGLFGLLLLQLWSQSQTLETISYSAFEALLQDGRLSAVSVTREHVVGTLKAPMADGRTKVMAVRIDPELAKALDRPGVEVTGTVEGSVLGSVLSWVVPPVLFFLTFLLLGRSLGGGQGLGGNLLSIGRSKARIYAVSETRVTFADVAGVDEAKEELSELVAFLKDPKTYGRLGARIPKGVLLVGPPGTGKTLLARAVAGEANVPFFSISGSEFVEMFVGVGAARVRDLFTQARAKAPAIIFIDELDALGRARGAYGAYGGHDEKEQTLNQLLAELDGFDPSVGVVLLAATNRPEILDPALLRAGRFDRQVLVDRPDKRGRAQILTLYLRRVQCAADITVEAVAALTPGFTGADLANLVNEAAILATRRGADRMAFADIVSAIERIVAGLEKKNRLLNPREREIIAYHEMGHALVSLCLKGPERVQKVSIIPRGIGALGYTIQRPTEDRFLMTAGELDAKMAVLLGGRAAEQLVFDELSTGAADDLAKVTDIARSAATQYGMVPALGGVAYDRPPTAFLDGLRPELAAERRYSEETAREIDCAVRELIARAQAKAASLLDAHRTVLERGARALLEKETLMEADLLMLLDGARGGTVASPAAVGAAGAVERSPS